MGGFVVFEGLDGAGKSTQIQLLAGALAEMGVSTETVREPGGTPAGEDIRAIMFGPNAKPLRPLTWAFLMNSARAQLVAERIRPALESGRTVLADRYWYSTLAYQGGGEGIDLSVIRELSGIATSGLNPDLVVYLDLPADQVADRKRTGHPNVLDSRPLRFHQQVAGAYKNMTEHERDRWVCFDATQPAATLAVAIRDMVVDRLRLSPSVGAG